MAIRICAACQRASMAAPGHCSICSLVQAERVRISERLAVIRNRTADTVAHMKLDNLIAELRGEATP